MCFQDPNFISVFHRNPCFFSIVSFFEICFVFYVCLKTKLMFCWYLKTHALFIRIGIISDGSFGRLHIVSLLRVNFIIQVMKQKLASWTVADFSLTFPEHIERSHCPAWQVHITDCTQFCKQSRIFDIISLLFFNFVLNNPQVSNMRIRSIVFIFFNVHSTVEHKIIYELLSVLSFLEDYFLVDNLTTLSFRWSYLTWQFMYSQVFYTNWKNNLLDPCN